MELFSRRNMLAATAGGGLLTAASVAAAQTTEGIPQPNVRVTVALSTVHGTSRATARTPTFSCRPRPITARCRTCVSPSPMPICVWKRAAGTRHRTV